MHDLYKSLSCLLITAGFVLQLALPARSQTTSISNAPGTVVGTATDTNGNPLEGASVTLRGVGATSRQVLATNTNGFFEFRDVTPGNVYQIAIQAPGFSDWASSEFTVQPGQYKIVTDCSLRIEQTQTTVNVTYSSVEIATQQVEIAEKQRVFGVIPNFYVVYDQNPEPLTPKLKFRLAWKVSRDPVTITGVAFVAALKQAGDTPNYGQGASGYAKRFGAISGEGITDIMIGGAILPSLLHQDPRYFYQGTGTTKSRVLHAASTPFICRGDNGHLQPNYSSLGGVLGAAALTNAYYPSSDRGISKTFTSFGVGVAERMVAGLAQEFFLGRVTHKTK